MNFKPVPFTGLLLCSIAAAPCAADTIVYNGQLSGGEGQQTHEVIVPQFDSQGGMLQLNFVQIDLLTSVIGGYETTGSGTPVSIFLMLSADYFLNGNALGQTLAQVSTVVPNTSAGAATVFNTSTDQTVINDPLSLASWIGTGQLTLNALTTFAVSENPADVINFSGGGTARWTITYDYSVIPGVGGMMLLVPAIFVRGQRRRS